MLFIVISGAAQAVFIPLARFHQVLNLQTTYGHWYRKRRISGFYSRAADKVWKRPRDGTGLSGAS